MCTTPLHVTSSQLIASELFPVAVVKTLLYPGAVANGLVKNMTVPSWDNLLDIYNLTSVKEAPAVTDLQRLEVLLKNWLFPFLIVVMHISFVGKSIVLLGGRKGPTLLISNSKKFDKMFISTNYFLFGVLISPAHLVKWSICQWYCDSTSFARFWIINSNIEVAANFACDTS
jgi:hypothetical protein